MNRLQFTHICNIWTLKIVIKCSPTVQVGMRIFLFSSAFIFVQISSFSLILLLTYCEAFWPKLVHRDGLIMNIKLEARYPMLRANWWPVKVSSDEWRNMPNMGIVKPPLFRLSQKDITDWSTGTVILWIWWWLHVTPVSILRSRFWWKLMDLELRSCCQGLSRWTSLSLFSCPPHKISSDACCTESCYQCL